MTATGRQQRRAPLLAAGLGLRWQRQWALWMWQWCWREVGVRLTVQSHWECGPPMLRHEEVFVFVRC